MLILPFPGSQLKQSQPNPASSLEAFSSKGVFKVHRANQYLTQGNEEKDLVEMS